MDTCAIHPDGLRSAARVPVVIGLAAMLAGCAVKSRGPFEIWYPCPSSVEELKVRWSGFHTTGHDYYNDRAVDEYKYWLEREDAESLFVQHIATPALPESMMKSALLNCWVFYEGARRAAEDDDWPETRREIGVWKACVADYSYRYEKLPEELQQLGRCIERVADSAATGQQVSPGSPWR